MRPVSEATAKVTNSIFGRKYVALGRIVDQWKDIVGEDLATKVQPAGLKYRKFNDKKKPDAILEIATSSAHATRLHYQKDLILERINQIFGDRWVTDLRFVSVTSSAPVKPNRKHKILLSPQDEKYIQQNLDCMTDNEVKTTLENFGKSLLKREKALNK